jgi:hypothetical protein
MAHDTFWKKLAGTFTFSLAMPYHAIKALVKVPFGKPPGSGAALHDRIGKGSTIPKLNAAAS